MRYLDILPVKCFLFGGPMNQFFGGISLRLWNFHLLWTFVLVDKQLQDINALYKRQILTYTLTTNEY